jgi:RNA polymerase subunit RPABC4/transcription elongation factor Spt4
MSLQKIGIKACPVCKKLIPLERERCAKCGPDVTIISYQSKMNRTK